MPIDGLPSQGQFVRVRGRRYLVEDVEPFSYDDTLVRLACVDDDSAGTNLQVLWERELDAALLGEQAFGTKPIDRFDSPALFGAYLNTLRWASVTSTDSGLFQSPYRAGISIKAHQLEPLRKALLLPRVNLLIADDVGLGKTIEAALIMRELLLRQRARRIVVACPPSVVLQWREELETRFGLSFRVLDREYMLRMRRERGYATNPWATHSQFIISHALLRDETYASLLRAVLEDERASSLLILDEAHNAAPASAGKYAVDSRFTRVVRDLAHRFEHRLFLSATPHNGHSNSFTALLEILDPARFCRGNDVIPSHRDAVVVRRLKRNLRYALPGEFPERKVVEHRIEGLPSDAPTLLLSSLLEQYRELREKRLLSLPKAQQAAAGLVLVSLQKRLLSSIYAFHQTLSVHRKSLEKKHRAKTETSLSTPNAAQLDLLGHAPGMDDERADIAEDDVRAEENAQVERATLADPELPSAEEWALLDKMLELSSQTRNLADPRIERLVDWMRENLCADISPLSKASPTPPKAWNERRLIIFTEYADTKDYLQAQLRIALAEPERKKSRIATFHGGIDEQRREELKTAFNADPSVEPLRILICTDAAREGVNLQNRCSDLFHFDLPWNPSRVEQRNGRIDRTLQREAEVRCHYFLFPQRAEDRVLETMVKKTAVIADELGSVGAVVEAKLALLLEKGIPLRKIADMMEAIRTLGDDPEKAAVRKAELEDAESRKNLDAQLLTLRAMLEKSRVYLDYSGERLRDTVNASLSLLGAPPLVPTKHGTGDEAMDAYIFPSLDEQVAKDRSFWPLLDLLRAPIEKDEALWEWRRRAKLRPVVFDDPKKLDSGVVHLHLEHPLVKRLLGRFSAQGFVHDDLSRACVLRTKQTALPTVVLFGRLALYGPDAVRLHDEVAMVAATIQGASLEALPHAREALEWVKTSLGDPLMHRIDEGWCKAELLPRVAEDLVRLHGMLEARIGEQEREDTRKLAERGKKEGADLKKIVADQAKQLQRKKAEVEKRFGDGQLSLDFNAKEREQVDEDLAYWKKRIDELAPEAEREAKRIQRHYSVQSVRREIAGIVYLWPVSG